jgi:dephospho-CoA kinase
VVAPGTPARAAIAARFPGVLKPDGTLDRPALRRLIAVDASARKDLEAITHPAIRADARRRLGALGAEGAPVAVVEAALMVETGSYKDYDGLLVVTCSPETQLARLVARDRQPEAEARALVAAQLPLAEKERVATWLIRNDGTPDDLNAAVEATWAAIST